MPGLGKAHIAAWQAHDLAHATLTAFAEHLLNRNHGSKLSCEEVNTLCNLLERFDACQERIRIHRNKPLPDTARRYPKAQTRKEQRHAIKRAATLAHGQGLSAPRPAPVSAPESSDVDASPPSHTLPPSDTAGERLL